MQIWKFLLLPQFSGSKYSLSFPLPDSSINYPIALFSNNYITKYYAHTLQKKHHMAKNKIYKVVQKFQLQNR